MNYLYIIHLFIYLATVSGSDNCLKEKTTQLSFDCGNGMVRQGLSEEVASDQIFQRK